MTKSLICRFVLVGLAGAVLLASSAASLAQEQQEARDIRRLQRQLEEQEKITTEVRIQLEARLTRLETESASVRASVDSIDKRIWGLITAVLGLMLETGWGIVMQRKKKES